MIRKLPLLACLLLLACGGPNPAEPPERRYKWTAFGMERGVHVFCSPDGLHWTRNESTSIFSDIGGGVELGLPLLAESGHLE